LNLHQLPDLLPNQLAQWQTSQVGELLHHLVFYTNCISKALPPVLTAGIWIQIAVDLHRQNNRPIVSLKVLFFSFFFSFFWFDFYLLHQIIERLVRYIFSTAATFQLHVCLVAQFKIPVAAVAGQISFNFKLTLQQICHNEGAKTRLSGKQLWILRSPLSVKV